MGVDIINPQNQKDREIRDAALNSLRLSTGDPEADAELGGLATDLEKVNSDVNSGEEVKRLLARQAESAMPAPPPPQEVRDATFRAAYATRVAGGDTPGEAVAVSEARKNKYKKSPHVA